MLNVSIARRYARALIEVAGANADRINEQLQSFASLLKENRELADVATNPAYTRSQRIAVVEEVLKQLGISDDGLLNFFRLLVERNRMHYVQDIARLYQSQADVKAGRLRGEVVSAVPLAKDAMERIEKSLEKITQRNVELKNRVKPEVLGGVSAQVGSMVYDGTLRSQLDDLQRSLKQR